MLGAICGDIAGSTYEFHAWEGNLPDMPLFPPKSHFTDDTVLTVAVAKALVQSDGHAESFEEKLVDNFHLFVKKYPRAGYGGTFVQWIIYNNREPYNSWGNGSAMRVSSVGWSFDNLDDVEKYASISAAVTHNHPEGIKGAQAVAGSIFLARKGCERQEIRDYVSGKYGYDLNRSLVQIRETYQYEVSCQKSVPEAVIAFLESESIEDAIRKAIWLRGDADTQAAIAGSIAEAFYGMPEQLAQTTASYLDEFLLDNVREWQDWVSKRA